MAQYSQELSREAEGEGEDSDDESAAELSADSETEVSEHSSGSERHSGGGVAEPSSAARRALASVDVNREDGLGGSFSQRVMSKNTKNGASNSLIAQRLQRARSGSLVGALPGKKRARIEADTWVQELGVKVHPL